MVCLVYLCYKFWNALRISLSLSNSVRYTNEFVVFKPEHLLAKCVFIRIDEMLYVSKLVNSIEKD